MYDYFMIEETITPPPLGEHFDKHGIAATTYRHRPVFTVEDGRDIKDHLPGTHTKNLFLKDKKGALFLVTAKDDTKIDLKWLSKRLNCGRLSFAKPELMKEVLGVTPGSVTPFAVLNDTENRVNVIYDSAMIAHDLLNFHPLQNTMTTAIAREDLMKFCQSLAIEPQIINFSE